MSLASASLRGVSPLFPTFSLFRKISALALTAIFGISLVSPATAATYTGTNTGIIPDGGSPNHACGTPRDVQFTVTGFSGQPGAVSVAFTSFHGWIGDLEASLIAPDATTHLLFSRIGVNNLADTNDYGDDADFNATYSFGDLAASNIWTIAASSADSAFLMPAGSYRTQAAAPAATDSPGPAFTSINSTFAGMNPASVNGTWTLRFRDCAFDFEGSVSGAELTLIPAASVEESLGGRVLAVNGAGIRSVVVTISGGNLTEPKATTTGAFGNYRFDGLEVGETYIVSVSARRYTFANPLAFVTLQDSVSNINFFAN